MDERPQPAADAWRRELELGLRRLRDGEFERAEHHFTRAHRSAPTRPEVCFALGRERLRQGRVDEAESLLRTAWEGDPSLVSAAAGLARCLALHQGRTADALEVLDRSQLEHGPLALFDVVRSEVLLEAGRLDEARQAADRALARENDGKSMTAMAARSALARVFNQHGIDLAERGELDTALFSFKRAADCDPRWSGPHVNMGATFVSMGKRRPALAAFEAAVAVDDENPLAHLNLGLLCRDLGDPSAAPYLEHALELLRREPDAEEMGVACTALAEILLEQDDADGACALLSERLEQSPADPDAWVDLGAALSVAGDLAGAESCFRQSLELSPGHPGACGRLADLLAREGRYIEAAIIAEGMCGEDELSTDERRSR